MGRFGRVLVSDDWEVYLRGIEQCIFTKTNLESLSNVIRRGRVAQKMVFTSQISKYEAQA